LLIIFGGNTDNFKNNCSSLGIITAVTLTISTIVVTLRRSKEKSEREQFSHATVYQKSDVLITI